MWLVLPVEARNKERAKASSLAKEIKYRDNTRKMGHLFSSSIQNHQAKRQMKWRFDVDGGKQAARNSKHPKIKQNNLDL